MSPTHQMKPIDGLVPPARYLRQHLIKNNITIRKLSKVTGIAEAALSDYASGRRLPGVDKLKMIADSLGLSIDDLMRD